MGSPIYVEHEFPTIDTFLYLCPLFLVCQYSIPGVYNRQNQSKGTNFLILKHGLFTFSLSMIIIDFKE